MQGLQDEWLLLQKQHEHYEFAGLAIKLAAVLLYAFDQSSPTLLLAVLWLQDGIFKTFQSRLGARLVRLEPLIREGRGDAMQLHSEWLAGRPRGLGLLQEYALGACRPTVVFPYAVLIALAVISG